jgi:hypothetical protein
MNQKLEKWDRLLSTIYEDMTQQATSRTVFRETAALVAANPLVPKESDFFDFLERWYVDSVVMGLRRQVKIHPDSVSLAGLLEDIAQNPALLSRQRFVGLYPPGESSRAEKAFDKHIGSGAKHVDPAVVRADLDKLKQLATGCEEYADRLIAHRDRRPLQAVPTYPELNAALDFSEALLQRYYLLIRGDGLASVAAKFLYPWKRVFEVPWMPPG